MHDGIEITIDGETYLCVRGTIDEPPDGYEYVGRPEQRRLVDQLAAGANTQSLLRLRELMSESTRSSEDSGQHFAVALIDGIARELVPFTMFRERRPPRLGVGQPQTAVNLSDLLPPEAAREDTWHWLEIEIVDPDDAPVPGLSVRVELPDGQVRNLATDDRGLVRIDQIRSADECTISFPVLHGGSIEQL